MERASALARRQWQRDRRVVLVEEIAGLALARYRLDDHMLGVDIDVLEIEVRVHVHGILHVHLASAVLTLLAVKIMPLPYLRHPFTECWGTRPPSSHAEYYLNCYPALAPGCCDVDHRIPKAL